MTEKQLYKREIAYRLFSDELKDVEILEREDDEYSVQYVKTYTGAKISRLFFVGAIIYCEDIGNDTPFWKLRVSDPKGIFNCIAGQYSPAQVQNMVEDIEVPCFVSIVGKVKPREYNEKIYCDVAIESITVVSEATYNHWISETEEYTREREASNV